VPAIVRARPNHKPKGRNHADTASHRRKKAV
jgi:hypothetical protein